jgi:hypothetical protein
MFRNVPMVAAARPSIYAVALVLPAAAIGIVADVLLLRLAWGHLDPLLFIILLPTMFGIGVSAGTLFGWVATPLIALFIGFPSEAEEVDSEQDEWKKYLPPGERGNDL